MAPCASEQPIGYVTIFFSQAPMNLGIPHLLGMVGLFGVRGGGVGGATGTGSGTLGAGRTGVGTYTGGPAGARGAGSGALGAGRTGVGTYTGGLAGATGAGRGALGAGKTGVGTFTGELIGIWISATMEKVTVNGDPGVPFAFASDHGVAVMVCVPSADTGHVLM